MQRAGQAGDGIPALGAGRGSEKDICEHFPWSRQEIYHLVRVNHIRTFDQLISRYGQGHGCEICKPLVASVLASCWNEYLLKPAHLPLQDTNDRYFANIQKDGTYSVVPRMAAGEVTPDGLIAIGQIAKRYQLYSKITGGQRIDLFGARLEELPAIWRELAEAGFETGHAYGKSLRTVKSCVGSTWCRYGVQDSTALAVTLEHRYKGCVRRTRSKWRSPAVPANAPRRRERYRGDCHGKRLESLRLRQRRDEAATWRSVCQRSRRRDADPHG
jgi:NAD(P)H-nitrite reductase large subunit